MLVVTPVQSIAIFGYWDQPRRIVAWDDLVKGNWTWRRLRNELNFSPLELLKIQKDKTAWVTRGSLTLHDLPEMIIFPVNPFTDMQADLGEVWSMQWQPSLLHEMGVTYDQMKSRGLSAQIMSHFGFSLSSWFMLGFRIQHAEAFSNDECNLVFGLEKPELEKIVKEFSPTA
tara:strand:- start:14608 stop:15123 length:516 start_codon:yes stop_codon:yes gene_type:complete